jgi:gliding motility-associated-like protein
MVFGNLIHFKFVRKKIINSMKNFTTLLFVLISYLSFAQEICNNGIDDDADGLIDLKDTADCFCSDAKLDSNVFSLIPNPSFEQRSCCPSALSQLACADSWIQASNGTSDFFDTCGVQRIAQQGFSLPPTPLPNGSGYVGFYNNGNGTSFTKEYVGACLLDTLRVGINYQLEFYLANSTGRLTTPIGIFGTTSCNNLPFVALPSANSCPTIAAAPNWTLLASATVTCSTTSWVKVTLNFTPTQNYTAIVLGGTCGNLPGFNYYFADNFVLNKTSKFKVSKLEITDSGHYCRGNLVLKPKLDSIPLSFQWYKDSIAILGATDSTYGVPNGGLGNYQVRLFYDSVCITSEVYNVDTTIITFDIDSIGTCPIGPATGEVIVSNIQSGTSPYEFKINSSSFQANSSFNQLSPGNYSIIVRDSNMCEASSSVTVEAFPMPTASFSADTVCLGEPTNFIDNSTLGKGTITQWGWNTPNASITQNTSYTYGADGIYSVTHTVVSDSGCIDDTTIDVIVNPLPIADFLYNPIELYTFNSDVCFSNISLGAVSYSWDFDFMGTDGTSTQQNPCTVRFPNNQERTFRVKLVAISDKGCKDSTLLNIRMLDDFILYIPNSFTPNNDDKNDKLIIYAAGIETYKILIFNRWGELIFTSTDPSETWNGMHNGQPAPVDSYVYKVNVKGKNRQVKEIVGHVNVLR